MFDPTLAITLPGQPLIFAAPALVILTIVAIVVIRKSRRRNAAAAAWASASDELGIQFVGDGSKLGPVARGRVNNHVVLITPVHKGGKKRIVTQFSVKFEAPEAPKFNLVKRISDSSPIVDTGNPKFDAVVTVQTDQPDLLSQYLTGSRRAAILRLLTYWPSAQITNREAHLLTIGIEKDHDKLVDSVCHLVASAETFDRPSHTTTATTADTPAHAANTEPQPIDVVAEQHSEDTADIAAPFDAPVTSAQDNQRVNGQSDLLTEVRLDEAAVLNDLFNSGLTVPGGRADRCEPRCLQADVAALVRCAYGPLGPGSARAEAEHARLSADPPGIAARFAQLYQGRDVTWTSEVLRVGSADRGLQRVAAFIGSADGTNPESGRVVALTAIKPEPAVREGDVISFSGSLVNLDASQRLFHVA